MKYFNLLWLSATLLSCTDLELVPRAQSSRPTFYSNERELELAVNSLYSLSYFSNDDDVYTDNLWDRVARGNTVTFGTMTSDDGTVLSYWTSAYTCIARANAFLENKDKAKDNTPEAKMLSLEAEARAIRALQYSRLITHFGDVPLIVKTGALEDAYSIVRTAKEEILNFIFTELDWAAEHLPDHYPSGVKRLTRGGALAIKARTALYMGKWAEAKSAAEGVMELASAGIYALHPDYGSLFLKEGGTSKENIIVIPRSEPLGVRVTGLQPFVPNLSGGYGSKNPTWDLMVSYECIDGLPIDESPMYNPRLPFSDRDPRMTMTIVEFGIDWLGYRYQPHPDSALVKDASGAWVSNRNSRGVNVNSSWNGLVWKKGIDETWLDMIHDFDYIVLRYAEILLTYAEAKLELDEIDNTVLDAINQVRARAYGVEVSETTAYPAVTTTDPAALRTIIRRERRVEFPLEGLRYMDLIRWRIAEKALTRPVYGMPDPANQDRDKWFFAGKPSIDADGVPDWTSLEESIKRIAERNFDPSKQYLWPIPAKERLLNNKLPQNDGY